MMIELKRFLHILLFGVWAGLFPHIGTAETPAETIQAVFREGATALKEGRLQDAAQAVSTIKNINPHDLHGYYLSTQLLWDMRLYPELILEVEQAERDGYREKYLYQHLAKALFAIDSFSASYRALDKLEQLMKERAQS